MSQKQLEDEIIDALWDLLEIEGIPVPQETQVLPPGTRMTSPRSMRRHVYFHFQCDVCDHKWTSSKGTCEVLFFIYNLKEDIIENMSVKFHVRFFRQMCTKGCQQFIEPTMDEQENRQTIATEFAELVSRIINRIPKEQREKKQRGPLLFNHKQQLCEACSLGKCSYEIKVQNNETPVNLPYRTQAEQQQENYLSDSQWVEQQQATQNWVAEDEEEQEQENQQSDESDHESTRQYERDFGRLLQKFKAMKLQGGNPR